MGGSNVKGLYYMEVIYPSPNGQSVIPQEKLQKAISDGKIVPENPNAPKFIDGNMDDKVDQVIAEIWGYYDKNQTGVISRSTLKKFFEDALKIYALRQGRQSGKEVVAPGVNYSQALDQSVAKVTTNPNGQCSRKEFEDFLNLYDLQEALGSFLGISEVAVNTQAVAFVDTSQMKSGQQQVKKPVYRDYSQLQD